MLEWRDDFDRYVVRGEEPPPPDYDRDEWLDEDLDDDEDGDEDREDD